MLCSHVLNYEQATHNTVVIATVLFKIFPNNDIVLLQALLYPSRTKMSEAAAAAITATTCIGCTMNDELDEQYNYAAMTMILNMDEMMTIHNNTIS